MNRRTLLRAAGVTLLPVAGGCSTNTEEEEKPKHQNTPVETGEATPKDEDAVVDAGTSRIQLHLKVTGDHPDDAPPISSSDERIADVTLFSDVFSDLEEAARQRTEEGLVGDLFVVTADRETKEGTDAENAMEELPLMERTLEIAGSESTEEGVYVTHEEHTCFVFYRVFHDD